MKNLKVDQEKCIGCGTCVSLCEACFKLNEGGKAEVVANECSDCNLQEVVDSCPVKAISHE